MRKLVMLGAGGAALEALLVAQRLGQWDIVGFADDAAHLQGQTLLGVPILGPIAVVRERLKGGDVWFHCAIGKNKVRKAIAESFEAERFAAASLIDPSAVVAPSAEVGDGTYIGPLAFVGPLVKLGRHVLINVGASVAHHSQCRSFVQLCPGARISGAVELGEGVFVGSNGVVAPGGRVGDWATVGAVSFVVREVPAAATAVGAPARILAVPV